jgi:hypothetical protein
MFLKNYTSSVPVSETIHRIEKVLIRCGVSGITKEFAGSNGQIAALTFHIRLDGDRDVAIRLPADKERAMEALWLDYANGEKLSPDGNSLAWSSYKKKKRKDFADQAERTAWKIIQDWVEVQMSMIQMKQADAVEVFFALHLGYPVQDDSLWSAKNVGLQSVAAGEMWLVKPL